MRTTINAIKNKFGAYLLKSLALVDKGWNEILKMRNCPPNIFSIFWIIICIRVCFAAVYAETTWMEYLLWGVVCLRALLNVRNPQKLFPQKGREITLAFAALAGWMLIGCAFNPTAYALKSVVIVACIYCLIVEMYGQNHIQICYFRVFYHIAITFLLVYTISGINIGNTMPGCVVFLNCGYLIAEMLHSDSKKTVLTLPKTTKSWVIVIDTCLALWISWESRARTASFVLLIVLFVFLIFTKINKKYYSAIFYVGITCSVLFCVLYAFISYMPFYDAINKISNQLFAKNLDSSRPQLWRESLAGLSWWQYFVGAGTGILPPMERFEGSSFHNSYIQMIMQNGLVGLVILYAVLWAFWKKLAQYADDMIVKFVLASFAGIVVYNCFETTLLQNKAFLGAIQWMLLVLGLLRCEYLQRKGKAENTMGKLLHSV